MKCERPEYISFQNILPLEFDVLKTICKMEMRRQIDEMRRKIYASKIFFPRFSLVYAFYKHLNLKPVSRDRERTCVTKKILNLAFWKHCALAKIVLGNICHLNLFSTNFGSFCKASTTAMEPFCAYDDGKRKCGPCNTTCFICLCTAQILFSP